MSERRKVPGSSSGWGAAFLFLSSTSDMVLPGKLHRIQTCAAFSIQSVSNDVNDLSCTFGHMKNIPLNGTFCRRLHWDVRKCGLESGFLLHEMPRFIPFVNLRLTRVFT